MASADPPLPPEDRNLAETLVQSGVLRPDQLESAIDEQRQRLIETGETIRLRDVLLDQGLVEAEALPAEPPLQGGQPFGRYRLLDEVGRGGMGVVWRAWDEELHRTVALKCILSTNDPGSVERFLREARAAARLRHPNIAGIHDVGLHEGQHYYTADFIDGVPLDDPSLEPSMTIRRAVEVVLEVARALEYAHGAGIVHRDIKPGNILLDRQGRPHLLDFGLAKDVRDLAGSGLTMDGAVVGTPQYMSPEQAEGRTGEIGPASDQFSLGIVLYQLLTRRLPFEGRSLRLLLDSVVVQAPARPTRVNRKIPFELEAICLRALEKDPARRYPSTAELAADLERFLRGEKVHGARSGAFRPAGGRGTPLRIALAATAALLVAATATVAILGRDDPAGEDPVATPEARRLVEEGTRHLEAVQRASYDEGLAWDEVTRLVLAARAAAEGAIGAAPGWAEPHRLLGRIREFEGRHPIAEEAYRRALEIDPASPAARSDLARVLAIRAYLERLEQQGAAQPAIDRLFEEAHLLLDEGGAASEFDRDFVATLGAILRGELAEGLRLAREAIARHRGLQGEEDFHWLAGLASEAPDDLADHERAIAIRPRHAFARFARAVTRLGQRDVSGAIADCDEALRVHPTFAIAWQTRGQARLDFRDLRGAIDDFTEAIRHAPRSTNAYLNRGVARIRLGDFDGAVADYGEVLRIDPRNAAAYMNRGVARRSRGHHREAIEDFSRALAIDPEMSPAYNQRGIARSESGDHSAAIADFDAAIERAPANGEYVSNRGLTLLKRGDTEGAIADFTRAIRVEPAYLLSYVYRGEILARLGDRRAAIADYEKVLSIAPAPWSRRGDVEKALEELRRR